MNLRIAKHSDYETLKEWWAFWRFPAPSFYSLPQEDKENFCGVIAYKDDKEIASGFLYKTNSTLCWVEYIVTNPMTSAEERSEGVQKVLNSLSELAIEFGYVAVFSSLKNENLINKYKDNGFVEGSKNTTEMIKILQ